MVERLRWKLQARVLCGLCFTVKFQRINFLLPIFLALNGDFNFKWPYHREKKNYCPLMVGKVYVV